MRESRSPAPSVLLVAVQVLVACGATSTSSPAWPGPESSEARALYDRFESRLLRAQTLHVRAQLRSGRPHASDLTVTLDLAAPDRARLHVAGALEGRIVSALLVSDGARLVRTLYVHRGPSRRSTGTPPARLRESLLVGLTRMGLLHNAARLASFELPDHAAGGVRDWVRAARFEGLPMEPVPIGGHLGGHELAERIRFAVQIAGLEVAEAELWLLGPEELPFRRRQDVRFGGAPMAVEERYQDFDLELPMAPDRFALP